MEVEKQEIKKILFVCTGNTCRSPMAEGILKHLLDKKGAGDNFVVSSAGLMTAEGLPPSEFAVEVLKERGIDISSHRSKQITQDMIKDNDLILGMTLDHKQQLRFFYNALNSYMYGELVSKEAYDLSKELEEKSKELKMPYNPSDEISSLIDRLRIYEVNDPFGKDKSAYQEVAEQLFEYAEVFVDLLLSGKVYELLNRHDK